MTKWNKKTRVHQNDASYRPGDHGSIRIKKSLQRYNAILGCFEEVPSPGAEPGAADTARATLRKSRMKVMIKPYTNEAGEVVVPQPGVPAQQRVARYEEVVEDNGQVVVHVPDSAAGPDGVIRLLQVTNEDGSVHYINADHAEIEEDFTMENAMQMILTEVDTEAEREPEEAQPGVVETVEPQEEVAVEEYQEPLAVSEDPDDADLSETSVACYVCGQSAAAGDDAPMTPLMAGVSRHSRTPLAELLADTVQRELTVSTADGVCTACLSLLDRCDRPDGPLKQSASRLVRNVLAVRVGDLTAIEGGADYARWKRNRSRVGRPSAAAEDSELTDPGAAGNAQWTPVLDFNTRRKVNRRPREVRAWSPTPLEPKLEHLTDLRVPSEMKRSARIAIRKNAVVATAVHASNRPRVLVVPDLQSRYLSDPPPQRRPYRRLNMNPAKGRRGRPKLPNLPENEPINVVAVASEGPEKQPPDIELVADPAVEPVETETEPAQMGEADGAGIEPGQTAEADGAGTEPGQTEEEEGGGEQTGPLLVEEDGTSSDTAELSAEAGPGGDTGNVADLDRPEPEHIYIDLHEIPEREDGQELEWQPKPGCSCLMCTELTAEEQAVLAADENFCTTFVCQVCGEHVVGKSRYKRHEASCGQRRSRRSRLIHECSTCNATFKSARLRNEHYAMTGHEKRSRCPVCDKFFHPDFLRIHLNSHSGAFLCRVCDTHFSSKATLKSHMYIHSGLKPHKCDVCLLAFRTPSSLFMHKRYHHSNDRPYACNFCPKRFASRATLKIHVRQHTGERPFKCKLCSKAYTRMSSLTQHLRTHTQERRFVCMTCGKRFDSKTYLKVHMNRHEGIRAHSCARCGRGFFSRPNLLKHMQVLCYREDYGKSLEEQEKRTLELRAATQREAKQEVVEEQGDLHIHDVEMDDDDIQTTEVILSIESIPEDGELLVGRMVQ